MCQICNIVIFMIMYSVTQDGQTDCLLYSVLCIHHGQCWRTCEALCDMSCGARKNKILEILKQNGTFCREQDGWDEQARQNRNQDSNGAVCRTTLACTTLGSSSAILTIVMDVKTMTQSVPMSSVNILNRTTVKVHGRAVYLQNLLTGSKCRCSS